MSAVNQNNSKLAEYLKKRLDYLCACDAEIENKLSDDTIAILNASHDEGVIFQRHKSRLSHC